MQYQQQENKRRELRRLQGNKMTPQELKEYHEAEVLRITDSKKKRLSKQTHWTPATNTHLKISLLMHLQQNKALEKQYHVPAHICHPRLARPEL